MSWIERMGISRQLPHASTPRWCVLFNGRRSIAATRFGEEVPERGPAVPPKKKPRGGAGALIKILAAAYRRRSVETVGSLTLGRTLSLTEINIRAGLPRRADTAVRRYRTAVNRSR